MKHYRAIPAYYDAEYSQQDMLQSDVPFFLNHLPRRTQDVLELAVGTGRAAIPIAQAGHRVIGIDNDARMLRLAQRKRDMVGLSERRLALMRGDIREFSLDRRFDWICIFFNTFLAFTTLSEQDRILQTVRRHLKPSGRFWLDIFQPNLQLLAQDHSIDLEPMVFHVPEFDRTIFKTTEVKRDPARQVQRITFHYTWFDADGMERHESRQFDLTFLFPRELQLLLERNGLRIDRLYGNYDGSRVDADSPRLIASCALA